MFDWLFEPARMQFCEETLSGPIAHPADTWTNIGPVIAGFMILFCARRPLERLLGAAALWTGVASAYFHAANTILGETLDLSGMFLFILTIMAIQHNRAKPQGTSTTRLTAMVLAGTIGITVLSAYWAVFASPTFAVLVVIVIVRGIYDRKLGPYAWAMVATFAVAWTLWWLDFLHVLCIPGNHILTGHGIWHLLNGLVFWFTYLHYDATCGPLPDSIEQPAAA